LCDDCVDTPHRKAKNQSHTVVDIAVHLTSPTFQQHAEEKTTSMTCYKIHGEPLKLHCATCDKTICMECAAFEHGSQ
jgi:hypothetical protein